MADWQFKIDIKDEWRTIDDKLENGEEIEYTDWDRLVTKIISSLDDIKINIEKNPLSYPRFLISDIDEISDDFRNFMMLFATDDNAIATEEIDYIMDDLYDLGDLSLDGKLFGKKFIWIGTF